MFYTLFCSLFKAYDIVFGFDGTQSPFRVLGSHGSRSALHSEGQPFDIDTIH